VRQSLATATLSHNQTGQQVKWSKLVKSGQKFKDWSKERDLSANIDIFGYLCKFGLQD